MFADFSELACPGDALGGLAEEADGAMSGEESEEESESGAGQGVDEDGAFNVGVGGVEDDEEEGEGNEENGANDPRADEPDLQVIVRGRPQIGALIYQLQDGAW